MKNRSPDARKVYVPTKSWAGEESRVLRSPEDIDAKRGIVHRTVLGESWVHTCGEGSSGPRWVLGSAGLAEHLFSGNGLVGFLLPHREWLASSPSRVKGHASPSMQAQSHSPSRAGTGFWGLAQGGLVSWSSDVGKRLTAVLGFRIGFFSAVAGYVVPAFIFHAFSVLWAYNLH